MSDESHGSIKNENRPRWSRNIRWWATFTIAAILLSIVGLLLLRPRGSASTIPVSHQTKNGVATPATSPPGSVPAASATGSDEHTKTVKAIALRLGKLGYTLGHGPLNNEADALRATFGLDHLQAPNSYPFEKEWRLTQKMNPDDARSFLKVQSDSRFSLAMAQSVKNEWERGCAADLPRGVYDAVIGLLDAAINDLQSALEGPGNELERQWKVSRQTSTGSYDLRVTIRDSDTKLDGPWSRALVEFVHITR